MFRRTIALVCLITLPALGCSTYTLANRSDAAVGMDVRVRVTPEQAGRLMETARIQDRRVAGTVVEESTAQGLLIETLVPGAPTRLFQRVEIPEREIVEVEIREFSAGKTALFVGALVGVAAAVGFTAQALGGSSSEGGDGPDDRAVVPAFRFGTR